MRYFLILVLLVSCAADDAFYDNYTIEPDIDYEFKNIIELTEWVNFNVRYSSDESRGLYDRWQTAHATLKLRTGDCEDLSILLLALAQYYFGVKGEIASVKYTRADNSTGHHVIMVYDNVVYDATWRVSKRLDSYLEPINGTVKYRLTYRAAIEKSFEN